MIQGGWIYHISIFTRPLEGPLTDLSSKCGDHLSIKKWYLQWFLSRIVQVLHQQFCSRSTPGHQLSEHFLSDPAPLRHFLGIWTIADAILGSSLKRDMPLVNQNLWNDNLLYNILAEKVLCSFWQYFLPKKVRPTDTNMTSKGQ